MKLGTVEHEGHAKVVAVIDSKTLLDLSADFSDMVALVEAGPQALQAIRGKLETPSGTLAMQDISMRCPIMPAQFHDCLVHEAHLRNANEQVEKITGQKAPNCAGLV